MPKAEFKHKKLPPVVKKKTEIFKDIKIAVTKHKKFFLMLSIIFAFAAIIAYLFYSKIITLEKLAYLWSLAMGWLSRIGEKILPYAKNLWKNILYYASPQGRYFYRIFGIIIALIALACFMIIAKKADLSGRLRAWLKKRKKEIIEKRLAEKKPVKKGIRHRKMIGKEEAEIFEKIKKTIKQHKALFTILMILVVCCITFGILFYLGIISTLYITEFVNDMIPFVREIGQNIALIMRAYYVYVIFFLATIAIISILYLKRESLAGMCLELGENFKDLPIRGKIIIFVLVVAALLIILTSILIALGYLNIVPK